MADSVEVLTKVKLADWPGASADALVVFCQMMEVPSKVFAQPSELPGLVGLEGRLLPLNVQPYQKLLRSTVPVFCRLIV